MKTLAAAAVAFAASTSVDLLMALWVRAVARAEAYRAAVLSMACAACLLLGIERVIGSGVIVTCAWVSGYGVGSWVAVKLSRKGAT